MAKIIHSHYQVKIGDGIYKDVDKLTEKEAKDELYKALALLQKVFDKNWNIVELGRKEDFIP